MEADGSLSHRGSRTTVLRATLAQPRARLAHLLLAVAALVPQLLTRPGVVDADTKTYLFLEPGRYLRQSLSMWDPTVGLGTVTHLQIGYLFPMGPFFWATHALRLPTWAAERLWVGCILLAAGTGVWWLARSVGLHGVARFAASIAYMLSPYSLQYIGHSSVMLLAFAALPWLVLLADRATTGSWRPVAAVALVVAAAGSVDATTAIYVCVGPVLWLVAGAFGGRFSWRQVAMALWHSALAVALVSAWWAAGLVVEGGYGIDVLRYTETVQAVSTTSLASEVVRGLGYWYFYGGDNFGPWLSAMPQFTQQLWLIGVGYLTPLLALAAAVSIRWRHRAGFLAMTVVGVALAEGAHPLAAPTLVSRLMGDVLSSGTVGLALRSTDRATPLVLLGLAALLGAGIGALEKRAPGPALVVGALSVGVVVLANPALWNGTSVPSTFVEKPVTHYERQAASMLNHTSPGTAVLGLPGQDFASTDFGSTTVDPVWPALLNRPFVTREEQAMGSLPTEDLLYGMDDPIQSGVADP
ncbi:MAG TPA: alpha-(1-_3)-arabinofuranosyltransferase family protein, partial [Acidimicrobiales bacterium]|nr:alpha-(1->3)-arabinofuranosyltransferase family protein [Acidimicrobiales bacterium]